MWRSAVICTALALLPCAAVAINNAPQAQKKTVTARVHIRFTSALDSSIVRLEFYRRDVAEDQLVVASLNLAQAGSPRAVETVQAADLGTIQPHLTGWFVVQQQSQELWLGLTLRRAETTGTVELRVPGILIQSQSYPPQYELVYASPEHTLSRLADGADGVVYATVTEITAECPDWVTIITDSTTGWQRSRGNTYTLKPPTLKLDAARLTFQEQEDVISAWIAKSFGSFSGGFAAATIGFVVLIQLSGSVRRWHRGLFALVLVLSLALVVYVSGVPLNLPRAAFGGAPLLGLALPALVFLLLPTSALTRVAGWVYRWRVSGEG